MSDERPKRVICPAVGDPLDVARQHLGKSLLPKYPDYVGYEVVQRWHENGSGVIETGIPEIIYMPVSDYRELMEFRKRVWGGVVNPPVDEPTDEPTYVEMKRVTWHPHERGELARVAREYALGDNLLLAAGRVCSEVDLATTWAKWAIAQLPEPTRSEAAKAWAEGRTPESKL